MDGSDGSDGEIIERSRAEPEVFGEIFDRHFKLVYRFCARRTLDSQVEDIAGDVFRKAFERRELYDVARQDARPWLLAIARNLIRDGLRSQATHRHASERILALEGVRTPDLDEQVASVLDDRRNLELIAAALELLPADEVEPLLLYVWEDLSYAEIAEILDVPIGTIRSRLSRIRERLSELVDRREIPTTNLPVAPPRRIE
jgi:RNA polymerase sigma factor (sigma-70 family)